MMKNKIKMAEYCSKLVGGIAVKAPNCVHWPEALKANHGREGGGIKQVFIRLQSKEPSRCCLIPGIPEELGVKVLTHWN